MAYPSGSTICMRSESLASTDAENRPAVLDERPDQGIAGRNVDLQRISGKKVQVPTLCGFNVA